MKLFVRNHNLNPIGFLFLLLTVTSSCDKKNNTVEDLLTSHSWKIISYTLNDENCMPDCMLDDCTTYKSNGNYTISNGTTKCYPSDPEIFDDVNMIWHLSDDNKTIYFEYVGGSAGAKYSIHFAKNQMIFTCVLEYGTVKKVYISC
jgi:hypothetical protein